MLFSTVCSGGNKSVILSACLGPIPSPETTSGYNPVKELPDHLTGFQGYSELPFPTSCDDRLNVQLNFLTVKDIFSEELTTSILVSGSPEISKVCLL